MKGVILLALFGGCAAFFARAFFYLMKFFNQETMEKDINKDILNQENIWTLMKKKENKNIVNFCRMMVAAIIIAIVMMYIANTFSDY